MIGSSRESLAACQEGLDARRQDAGFAQLSGELFAVADLLVREGLLRSTLADSGQPHAVRDALVRQVLGGKVSDLAVDIVLMAVARRWAEDMDLVMAIEQLADQAAFTVAEADGSLDATEEELFRFGRAVDSSSDLQMALTDPAQSSAAKAAIVGDLLQDRSTAASRQVLQYAVGHLHGRRIDSVIDELCDLAARQRERVVAEVRVAAPRGAAQCRGRPRRPRRCPRPHRRRGHRWHRRIPHGTGTSGPAGLTGTHHPHRHGCPHRGPRKRAGHHDGADDPAGRDPGCDRAERRGVLAGHRPRRGWSRHRDR
jgi:F-type H+-transporting ATPase subunit delta